jgi:hypothetical protein|tara:strand:- start:1081 stop:1413 length:333 start_codon:yes stop_codon:yes gene_type:complete
MNGKDVVWSKEMKDMAVYCMTSSTAIDSIGHYLVEYIAREDAEVQEIECNGECQYEIDFYIAALTKAVQKSKHFKDMKKFLQTASDYYGGTYFHLLVKWLKENYGLEVTA